MNLKLLLLFALLGVALSLPQNGGKTIRTEDCEDEEPQWKCNWWKKKGKCSNNATDWTDGQGSTCDNLYVTRIAQGIALRTKLFVCRDRNLKFSESL